MPEEAITIRTLSKWFRTQMTQRRVAALEQLSLSIQVGEIFGFLGPNGAGKTTTIKILNGLVFPSGGEVEILGRAVSDAAVRQRIGYLPEHPYFYPHLTGYELLDFCGQIFGLKKADRRERVSRLLSRVGLERAANVLVSKYSKGMVQRLGLAQALVNDPQLVIFDEPMEGLDPLGRRDVKNIMLELKKENKTVFFSTHILPDVEAICDRVGILSSGRLISVGRIDELLRQTIESIEIRARGLDKKALKLLSEEALQYNRIADEVRLVLATAAQADRAVELILKCGGKLVSLLPYCRTLEEHFVKEVSGIDEGTGNRD